MKFGYADFLKLCRVTDSETWCDWLSIRSGGVYVKEPPAGLEPSERAILADHPTGNLTEPALRFPCSLRELQVALEVMGVYGCIDPFDMADWVLANVSGDTQSTGGNANVSDKLAKMNLASMKFWGNADRDDRGSHPNNAMVAAWLVKQGFSSTLADKATTIIRPDWAQTGRKPEK